ncbi:hypothetical protein EJ02DRAFT_320941, partial [Clathrospora elynae]
PAFENLQDLSVYLNANRSKTQILPNRQTMVGALDTLVGRSSTMTSLHITTAGSATVFLPHSQDDRLYASWARFLASVRNSLCDLFFEQGEGRYPNPPLYSSFDSHNQTKLEVRPMDRHFIQWILPVLLDAPWPRMKRMEIRGVG